LVGVAYAGAGGTNVYYDNVWFTAVEERREGRIHPRLTLNLLQNSPNPFQTGTSISYVLPARGKVSLKVYNTTGQVVRTLYDGEQDVGIHTVPWDGLDRFGEQVPAGVYIYNLSTRMGTLSKKLVLVR